MATGSDSKGKRSRSERSGRRGEPRFRGPVTPHHVAIHPVPHPTHAGDGPVPEGWRRRKVGRRLAASRIGQIAARLAPEWADAAALLDALAGRVAAGRRRGSAGELAAGAVSRCLDEAAREAPGAGRFALDEGAAWAIAWLGARFERLFSRLVEEVREAESACRQGDTRPAALLFAAAGLFDDPALRTAAERSVALLEADIGRWTTPSGAPVGGSSAVFVSRVTGWAVARESAVAAAFGEPWDEATGSRFHAAAVAALRLLGDHGRMPVREGGEGLDTGPVLDALRGSRGMERGRRRLAATIDAVARSPRSAPRRTLPRDAVDGTVAILRTGWGRGAVRVLFDFGGPVHRLEIAAGDRLVIDGPWTFAAAADGEALLTSGAWSVSCFESDDEATFLEIVTPLADGLQAERQVVILPADRILLLVDSVTDAGARLPAERRPRRIAYAGAVTLAGIDATPETATREHTLAVGRRRWRVLPLPLPEWRAAHSPGTFDADAGTLAMRLETEGGRITAPLWIDADPRRVERPLTWRQLTVADQRLNLARHEAVGFRVQAGLEQWLLYRALDAPRNRTLLGCNVACEFLLGRIRRSGEVERSLEIE